MRIKEKIKSGNFSVGVIGLGYVGLPLAVEYAKVGIAVKGFDLNSEKVSQIRDGKSYVIDIADEELRAVVTSKALEAFDSIKNLKNVDAIVIAVPTPLSKSKEPDISYIQSAVEMVKTIIHKDMLITLESTTYPGTTRELLGDAFESMGFVTGKDIFVAFSPERVDPGNQIYKTKNTPKVVGGLSAECTEIAALFYEKVIDTVVRVEKAEEAEMSKLLENTFRAVNIGLVNEMLLMADRMGINIWNVIDAAKTKPFGFMPFYPGPGIGGHCIPLDPSYLSWKAKSYNFYNRFIELATDINGNMPRFVISKLYRILNKAKKSINGSNILILGVAYKPNIDDVRESPALDVYELLSEEGANVEFNDPFVESFKILGKKVYSKPLSERMLESYDAVIMVTGHSAYDEKFIEKHAKSILDTRSFFKISSGKVVKL